MAGGGWGTRYLRAQTLAKPGTLVLPRTVFSPHGERGVSEVLGTNGEEPPFPQFPLRTSDLQSLNFSLGSTASSAAESDPQAKPEREKARVWGSPKPGRPEVG